MQPRPPSPGRAASPFLAAATTTTVTSAIAAGEVPYRRAPRGTWESDGSSASEWESSSASPSAAASIGGSAPPPPTQSQQQQYQQQVQQQQQPQQLYLYPQHPHIQNGASGGGAPRLGHHHHHHHHAASTGGCLAAGSQVGGASLHPTHSSPDLLRTSATEGGGGGGGGPPGAGGPSAPPLPYPPPFYLHHAASSSAGGATQPTSPSPRNASYTSLAAAAAMGTPSFAATPLARTSSPGYPRGWPPHLPPPPPHSASTGGASLVAGRQQQQLTSGAGGSRATRTTIDDVEAAVHDQAATGGGGGGSGGSGSGRGIDGNGGGPAPKRSGAAGAAVAAGSVGFGAVSAAAAAAATASSTPSVAPPAASAATLTGMPSFAPSAAAVLPAGGSRVEVSVSVLEPQPSLGQPFSGAQSPTEMATSPARSTAAAAVGVPVLLLTSGAAAAGAGGSAAGMMASTTVMGRPATEAADVTVVADTGLPEVDVDGIDIVATIAGGGGGAAVRRRRGTSGGGATDGDETTGGGAGEEDAAGPCTLPSEVRRRLRGHLGRQRMKRVRTWTDLSHIMAGPRPGYWLLGTMLLVAVLLGCFLFMAGQYEFLRPVDVSSGSGSAPDDPAVATDPGQPATGSGSNVSLTAASSGEGSSSSDLNSAAHFTSPYDYNWGPSALARWLAFWKPSADRTFSFDYLRSWGGRYGPDLAYEGEWWRWLTGLLLHQSSLHLTSNLALLLVLSTYLEALYGFWRVLPVFFVAGLAGNFVSAFFESPCTLVVGASGCVFGLLGAYAADAGLNFESIPLLWLRLLGMAVVVAFMVALQVTDHARKSGGAISHASHVGGFVAGLLLAAVLLPDFKARRAVKVEALLTSLGLESHLPARSSPPGRQLFSFWQRHRFLLWGVYGLAAAAGLLALLAVPLALYLRTFKRMACGG